MPALTALSPDRLLIAILFCFGPLVYLAPLSAAPLLFAILVATGWLGHRSSGLRLGRGVRALLPLAPLFVWMFLSIVWALDRAAALSLAVRLGLLVAAGGMIVQWFTTIPLDRLRTPILALAGGFAVAAMFLIADLSFDGAGVRLLHRPLGEHMAVAVLYDRGATIHAVLFVPLAVALWRLGRPRWAILQALIGLVAILATASLSAKLALGGALVAAAAIGLGPRLRWGLLGLPALGVVVLPFVFPIHFDVATTCWLDNNKASALHRVYIWNFAAERIAEHPIVGWGLDASRRIPGGDTPLSFRRCDRNLQQTGNLAVVSSYLPLHPHNAILQLWLELGGIGALLGFGGLATLLARAYAAPEWQAPATQAAFGAATLAGLSVALVSFGVWQEWFLSALFFAAAIAGLMARLQPPNK